jgi:hypothetical protein
MPTAITMLTIAPIFSVLTNAAATQEQEDAQEPQHRQQDHELVQLGVRTNMAFPTGHTNRAT